MANPTPDNNETTQSKTTSALTAAAADKAIDRSMTERAIIAYKTIMYKEVTRFIRIWTQTLLPPAITMTLYFVIFGNLIGARIGQMDGHDYMSFIVPGLIMMAVISSSYGNVVSSFFSAKFQNHVEELLVSPTPNWVILLGWVSGGVARGICVGAVVTLVSLFFTRSIQIHNAFLVIVVVVLTAVLFSIGGFINAIYARKFDDVAIVPNFVLTPLTYLGGVFYSIKMLPDFWQAVSRFNPIFYMINVFRHGVLGVSDINPWYGLTFIIIFIIILYTFALTLLNRGVGLRS